MNPPPVYTPISDERIQQLIGIAAEYGARIHVVRSVPVNQGCDWNYTISEAATCIVDEGYRKCFEPKVAQQFQPVSKVREVVDIVLINYNTHSQDFKRSALFIWELETGLQATHPREIFAIGRDCPTLDLLLRYYPDSMRVVAPTEGLVEERLQFCSIEYRSSDRHVGIDIVDSLLTTRNWFAYREPRD